MGLKMRKEVKMFPRLKLFDKLESSHIEIKYEEYRVKISLKTQMMKLFFYPQVNMKQFNKIFKNQK